MMFLNYFNYLIFLPLMFTSSLMIFMSNSWMSMWMLMEMNLISFISFIIFDKSMKNELPLMYFLTQAFNSYMFLFSTIMINYNLYLNYILLIIMNLSILMKMSIFPFHMWYMKLLKEMNWMNIFLTTTVQKIIPLYILSTIFNMFMNNMLFYFNMLIMIFSGMMSAIYGIFQTNVKIIMSMSSMIQLSWMVFFLIFSEKLSILYFILYTFISLNLYLLMYNKNIKSILDMNFLMKMKNYKIIVTFSIMSLASMPPFFGFLMKWISIMNFIINMKFFMMLMMIFNSLISMMFYLRISMNQFFMEWKALKFNFIMLNFKPTKELKMIFFNWMMISLMLIYEIL